MEGSAHLFASVWGANSRPPPLETITKISAPPAALIAADPVEGDLREPAAADDVDSPSITFSPTDLPFSPNSPTTLFAAEAFLQSVTAEAPLAPSGAAAGASRPASASTAASLPDDLSNASPVAAGKRLSKPERVLAANAEAVDATSAVDSGGIVTPVRRSPRLSPPETPANPILGDAARIGLGISAATGAGRGVKRTSAQSGRKRVVPSSSEEEPANPFTEMEAQSQQHSSPSKRSRVEAPLATPQRPAGGSPTGAIVAAASPAAAERQLVSAEHEEPLRRRRSVSLTAMCTIPAAALNTSSGSSEPGVRRSGRVRIPVLESWRGERAVFQRKPGEATPSLVAIECNMAPRKTHDPPNRDLFVPVMHTPTSSAETDYEFVGHSTTWCSSRIFAFPAPKARQSSKTAALEPANGVLHVMSGSIRFSSEDAPEDVLHAGDSACFQGGPKSAVLIGAAGDASQNQSNARAIWVQFKSAQAGRIDKR